QQNASKDIWHRRLGHQQVLQHLSTIKAILISQGSKGMCEACHLGKSSRLSF
ncbi:unnamed protein product, partial [Arabidopsis halleri]